MTNNYSFHGKIETVGGHHHHHLQTVRYGPRAAGLALLSERRDVRREHLYKTYRSISVLNKRRARASSALISSYVYSICLRPPFWRRLALPVTASPQIFKVILRNLHLQGVQGHQPLLHYIDKTISIEVKMPYKAYPRLLLRWFKFVANKLLIIKFISTNAAWCTNKAVDIRVTIRSKACSRLSKALLMPIYTVLWHILHLGVKVGTWYSYALTVCLY